MYFLIFLLVYTVAVYGLSWLITQSYIFEPLRTWLKHIADTTKSRVLRVVFDKLEYLTNCIVCTSVWVGVFLALFAPTSRALNYGNAVAITSVADVIVWAGW